MDQEIFTRLERIASLGIRILPLAELHTHFVFERDGCVVLVERRGESFGGIGSPGLLTPKGFAALVERRGEAWFVGRGDEQPAAPGQADAARRLFTDLKSALG